jgi:inorganic pyrophosphatase
MPFLALTAATLAFALSLPALSAQAPPPFVTPSCEVNPTPPPLPDAAARQLANTLAAIKPQPRNLWRDIRPVNADGTVNAYIEIARGGAGKWEFDIPSQRRRLDRTIPAGLGGYPTNYGFVPGTHGWDGDPFDALMLGAPAKEGEVVRGVAVGIMHMSDYKGLDSKVVLAPLDEKGRPRHALNEAEKQRIASFFNRYRQHETGDSSFVCVTGWGSADEGLQFVRATAAFVERARPKRAN